MKCRSYLVQKLWGSLKQGRDNWKFTAQTKTLGSMHIGQATTPGPSNTPTQQQWRDKYRACAQEWHTLTPEEKEPYELLAKELGITTYNAFISACLLKAMATEVIQSDPALLKATVTQAEKDRTITGNVTAVQPTASNLKATVTQSEKDRTVTGEVTTRAGHPGYTPVHKNVYQTGVSGDIPLWDPAEGKKFVITDFYISGTLGSYYALVDGPTVVYQCYIGANLSIARQLKTPYVSLDAKNNLYVRYIGVGRPDIVCDVDGYEI